MKYWRILCIIIEWVCGTIFVVLGAYSVTKEFTDDENPIKMFLNYEVNINHSRLFIIITIVTLLWIISFSFKLVLDKNMSITKEMDVKDKEINRMQVPVIL